MSAPLKTNTPAPSTDKHDWVHATMDELKSDSDNKLEVYNAKVGEEGEEAREHQQREEVEHQAREEAACLEREAGGGGLLGLEGAPGKGREGAPRERGSDALGRNDQEGSRDSRAEGPGGHRGEVGRGSEEDLDSQGGSEAAGGRGLKTKTSCNEETGKGGKCDGRAQWDARTWTLVSLVFILFV